MVKKYSSPAYRLKVYKIAFTVIFFAEDLFILTKLLFHNALPWYILTPSTLCLCIVFIYLVKNWLKNYQTTGSVVQATLTLTDKYRIPAIPLFLWIAEIRTFCGIFFHRDDMQRSSINCPYIQRGLRSYLIVSVISALCFVGACIAIHAKIIKVLIIFATVYLFLLKTGNFIAYYKNPHYINATNLVIKLGYRLRIAFPLNSIDQIVEISSHVPQKIASGSQLEKKLPVWHIKYDYNP